MYVHPSGKVNTKESPASKKLSNLSTDITSNPEAPEVMNSGTSVVTPLPREPAIMAATLPVPSSFTTSVAVKETTAAVVIDCTLVGA